MNHNDIMGECVNLALAGKGYTGTNPVVGAFVVKNGDIIGKGFHKYYGGNHAEIEAINDCEEDTSGADLYVTLEPCSHIGKTPPCVETIVNKKIKRVFIGVADPNPVNAGKGIEYLRENGIEVYTGFAAEACAEIIENFTKYVQKNQPFYTLKIAQTIDGKTAAADGSSKWITDSTSRQHAHYIRSISDGIMVGIGTILADNPELSARFMGVRKDPYKIILDSSLQIPLTSAVLLNKPEKCIIFTSESLDAEKETKREELRRKGAEIISCGKSGIGVDLKSVSDELIVRGISNVMVEGGSKVHTSFIKNSMADRIYIFTAGKIIGGSGVNAIGDLNIRNIENSIKLPDFNVTKLKDDFLFTGKFQDYTKDVVELTREIGNKCSQE